MNWKLILYLSIMAIVVTTTVIVVQFILANLWILFVILSPFVITGLWFLYNFALVIREKRLSTRAERRQKEIVIHTDGYGMTHLIDFATGHSQNLTLDARAYRNGHFEIPHPIEQQNLNLILGSRFAGSAKAVIQQPLQLPAPQLDFMTAMSDPLQVYAVIGPQRIGKSVLLQKLAVRLGESGRQCIVIGTKAEPNEWPGCERYIGGMTDSTVPDALERYFLEAERRVSTHAKQPPLAIILDDWLNTAEIWPEIAERFFIEAATRMLTAGIVPYFALQSDSKSDWGIKHGAQLKNNFTHLLLTAPRSNGRIDHNQLKAFIRYPGDKSDHPVTLPQQQITILQPTWQEQQILALKERGDSYNEIARQVFGAVGGNQTKQIKDILAKFGM